MNGKIAVIGAGVAGLACARELLHAGHDVVLYEKGRGPGGRAATRRTDTAGFDHGAQYFVVRDPAFAEYLAGPLRTGAVGVWRPRWPADTREQAPLHVGVPGMNALGRALAGGLDVIHSTEIVDLERDADGWRLHDSLDSLNQRHAAVVLAIPAPQAVPLLAGYPALAARLAGVSFSPCWAAMAEFEEPLPVELDADWRPDPVLPWLARNASKPRRGSADAWVLHAGTEWSVAHLEADPEAVAAALVARLPERLAQVVAVPAKLPPLVASRAHRWRYARVETPLGEDCLWHPELALGACGDWCIGARVEAAFLSGRALGLAMAGTLAGR
ncbi:MAG: NAD(P)/FAD-dependent oxidoreductase [Pseudomonadota bacterium]